MCGRYALAANASMLLSTAASQLDLQNDESLDWADGQADQHRDSQYNIAPQTYRPVLYRLANGNYEISGMRWGLIPHWTKHEPDHASQLKTINARDDTISQNSGMWNSIKGKKRCVVLADGFFEWLKKGSERIPHFMKRPNNQLMFMAGLWDSVTYEGTSDPIKTFTIVTTDSSSQLSFLHDRMPVIFTSPEAVKTWLDTSSGQFTSELASLMKPLEVEKLECYIVPKEVGKVGNSSPDFVKPVAERKGNISSFFVKQAKKAKTEDHHTGIKPLPSSPPKPSPKQSKIEPINPDDTIRKEPVPKSEVTETKGTKRPKAEDVIVVPDSDEVEAKPSPKKRQRKSK